MLVSGGLSISNGTSGAQAVQGERGRGRGRGKRGEDIASLVTTPAASDNKLDYLLRFVLDSRQFRNPGIRRRLPLAVVVAWLGSPRSIPPTGTESGTGTGTETETGIETDRHYCCVGTRTFGRES